MRSMEDQLTFSAFAGDRRVVSSALESMLLAAKERFDRDPSEPLLIFEDQTGRQVDFDLRGTPEEVVEKIRELEDVTGIHHMTTNLSTAGIERDFSHQAAELLVNEVVPHIGRS